MEDTRIRPSKLTKPGTYELMETGAASSRLTQVCTRNSVDI